MKHYIKTAIGISPGHIEYNENESMKMVDGIVQLITGLVGGTGQGGGASPIIWLAILVIMLKAYKESNSGLEIRNPVSKEMIKY